MLSNIKSQYPLDGRTDTQTDAGNDNTRRPKLASGKKGLNFHYKDGPRLSFKKHLCLRILSHNQEYYSIFHTCASCILILHSLISIIQWGTQRAFACLASWPLNLLSDCYKTPWNITGLIFCTHWYINTLGISVFMSESIGIIFANMSGSVCVQRGEQVVILMNFYWTGTISFQGSVKRTSRHMDAVNKIKGNAVMSDVSFGATNQLD